MLFSRSNLFRASGGRDGGGRHVQVAVQQLSPDALADAKAEQPFGKFQQLQIDDYQPSASNNIYFISVRRVGHSLLGLFPATIGAAAGVWCVTSANGVQWSSPIRVWESAVVTETRTRDWPVDTGNAADDPLSFIIEHDVHISLGGPDYFETLCVNTTVPRLCEYRFSAGASTRDLCVRMANGVRQHESFVRQRWQRSPEYEQLSAALRGELQDPPGNAPP